EVTALAGRLTAKSLSLFRGAVAKQRVETVHFAVSQELVDPLFAAQAGVLQAAERRAIEMAGGAVDPDVAGFDRARGAERGLEVVGEDRGGQPILGRIGDRERLLLVLPLAHREHWAEDLR